LNFDIEINVFPSFFSHKHFLKRVKTQHQKNHCLQATICWFVVNDTRWPFGLLGYCSIDR
jgi:hypothetical protein